MNNITNLDDIMKKIEGWSKDKDKVFLFDDLSLNIHTFHTLKFILKKDKVSYFLVANTYKNEKDYSPSNIKETLSVKVDIDSIKINRFNVPLNSILIT